MTRRLTIFEEVFEFVGCDEVAVGIDRILMGWRGGASSDETAYVTVSQGRNGIEWRSPWLAGKLEEEPEPSASAMDAVCDLHLDLVDWYVLRNPQNFCMHAAAVEIGGKAVLFPAVQKAGKSTMAVQLAQMGCRFFGDDAVALSPSGKSIEALGILPRLRLPLPKAAFDRELKHFVRQNRGPFDEDATYVSLPSVAPLGTSLEVGAVVILERGRQSGAKLSEASRGEAMMALIDRNYGRLEDPDGIFDRMLELATRSECLKLHYDRPRDAAKLLLARFDG